MMDHNERVRQQLIKSVSGLSDEQLNTRAAKGSWTIAQVLEHLYLIETSIAHTMNKAPRLRLVWILPSAKKGGDVFRDPDEKPDQQKGQNKRHPVADSPDLIRHP